MSDCIFCKIVAGQMPCHKVFENDSHLAFLSIFPNTDGVTVVIPKQHKPSYIFENDQQTIDELMKIAKLVAGKIDQAFEDVGRTGVIFEGFGVDHLHAKLYPMHGTGNMKQWQEIESDKPTEFFKTYPGYLSSHDCRIEKKEKLTKIAQQISDE
jgi:diadenosine tetraphosphate (Ap4A) HIT family hydrolase